MKTLALHNTGYVYLENAFGEWLSTLGYSKMSAYNLPHYVREFLHFLEEHKISELTRLSSKHIREYYFYLTTRKNYRREGALSGGYINAQCLALDKFFEFLYHKGMKNLPALHLKRLQNENLKKEILTITEIRELYKASEEQEYMTEKQQALNYQDKVLLSVYYACGLRRSEGIALCIEDINLDTRIVSVFRDEDGDWQFFGKEENISEEDAKVVSLEDILEIDPTLKGLLDINNGSHAHRENKEDNWIVEKYEE